jgi:hypothetical protein
VKLGSPFSVKVRGVSFTAGYPDNLYALESEVDRAGVAGEPLVAVLIRNPDNEYDGNAIEVHVPSLGDEWGMIGHMMAPLAARLAPELDAGERWQAEVEAVLVNPDHPDRPGISIKCTRVGEEEQA